MDVVYVVGPYDKNGDELRHSLRSLANVPHDQVWVAGHQHPWTRNVRRVPVRQNKVSKYHNVMANLVAACAQPELSDHFVLMNDDFFVLEPIEFVPKLHRGTIADHLATHKPGRSSHYIRGLKMVDALCDKAGHHGVHYSYGLHVPMVVNKYLMGNLLAWLAKQPHTENALHIRTLYGNMVGPLGTYARDCKVVGHTPEALRDVLALDRGGPYLSTHDTGFANGEVGRHLRALFPEPGPHE